MYYTYVPATGRITSNERTKIKELRKEDDLAGTTSPMISGSADSIHADDVMILEEGDMIPVREVLSRQDKPLTRNYVDHCRIIMLLPTLLKHATYPSIHAVFSEVTLEQNNSRHTLPDDSRQSGPLGAEEAPRTEPVCHAIFSAKRYHTRVHGRVRDLYRGPAGLDMARLRGILEEREIKHEQEAFEALREISHTEYLNGINEGSGKTAATKMEEVIDSIRSTRGSRITHMVMGARTYQRYLEKSGIRGAPVPGSSAGTPGIGPLPGLEYVTVVICPLADMEEGAIYAVDRHSGALYGQGTLVLEEDLWENEWYTGITEYYQYMTTDGHAEQDREGLPERRTSLKMVIPDG
ncbi:MAG: hypothetical protein MPJ78_19355 [Hyphomicrobiaceae bacterium]|nr:hypothetical protein [Hyphomicrobiaceae bacterium]